MEDDESLGQQGSRMMKMQENEGLGQQGSQMVQILDRQM